jgi:hypothetical protein
MERKKVKNVVLSSEEIKKREESGEEKKSIFLNSGNDTKIRWDKVKGINGKIVRFKTGDKNRKEELDKKKYRQLYVGIDGNDLYLYYEIIE